MKNIIILFVALVTTTFCNAQKIELERGYKGGRYTIDGKDISFSELSKVLKSNNESRKLLNRSKVIGVLGVVLGGVSGGMIAYYGLESISSHNSNWTGVGLGVGVYVVAFQLATKADKNIRHAVELYNSSLSSTSFNNFKPVFKVVVNGNSLGFSMNF